MDNYSHKKDIALVMAASFFYMACPMLTTPLITGFTGSLGAGGAVMGLAGGLMNLCSLVCRPFAGNLADLNSKYRLSLVGAVIMALSCIAYALAVDTWMVLVARVVNGIGFALCSVCMSTWIAGLLPPEKIGSGMGLYGTMNALSMAVSPAIGIKVHEIFGYRVAFWLASACAVMLVIIIQFTEDRGETVLSEEQKKQRKANFHLVEKRVIPIAIIITLFAIPYCATQSFIVGYVNARNLDVSSGLFFPIYAVALLIMRLYFRKYFDKVPFKYFLYGSSLCALLAMAGLWLMKTNWLMFVAAILMAGGYGIMCSVSQSQAILIAGEGKKGLANSTYYIGLDTGMALGPILGGVLFGNLEVSMFYPALMITAPLIVVVYLCSKRVFKR